MDFRSYVREHLPALNVVREEEIVEELSQHLEDLYQDGVGSGLDHDAAWARATAALPKAAEELAAAIRTSSRSPAGRAHDIVRAHLDEPPRRFGGPMLTSFRRDLRYALRTMLGEPGFTAVVVITLALGIGGTAVAYSAIDAIVLRRPPITDPDRVVSAYMLYAARATTNPAAGNQVGGASYLDYVDLRDSHVLHGLAAFTGVEVTVDLDGEPQRIPGQLVTGNFFEVLGVPAAIGRTLNMDDDRLGSPVRVAVLSYGTWQRRFGGDPRVIGRSLSLNGNAYMVIGVARRGFAGPLLGDAAEVWVPMAVQPEVRPPSAGALRQRFADMRLLEARDVRWLAMIGRLRQGTSATEAAAALDVVGRRLQAAYPESNGDLSATALPLGSGPGLRQEAQPLLRLLAVAVTLVLLIACANVASLLLARAVTRRREVAVRIAIGAGRRQLVSQWLTESILLGLIGSLGGLLVAYWGIPILYGAIIPQGIDVNINLRVLMFTIAIGAMAGVIFGLAPVIQLLQPEALTALRDEGGAVASGIRATRARSAFVILQVALSLVLLVGAGLFLRTLQQAYAVDLGYNVDRMLLAAIEPGDRYQPAAAQAFYADVLDRVNGLPGVVAAGAARVTVLSGASRTVAVSVDGRPVQPDRSNAIPVRVNVVSDRYLDTMGIPLVMGRNFQRSDLPTGTRVAVVSRALANRLWPHEDPVGKTLLSSGPLLVVGVVPDTVYRRATDRQVLPVYYLPLSQNYEASVTLHVRTEDDPMTLLPAIRRIVGEIDSRVALVRPRRLEEEFSRSLLEERTMVKFVGGLSGIALVLAAVGLYGAMSYATRQRTTEIGVRLALGAKPASILNMIVLRGLRLVAAGGAFGLAGAFVAVRFVRSLLFGVEPTDPLTWIAVSTALMIVGVLACAVPARRAMRVDPVRALRNS
ncbi:MAG TPA: ABC transporter permease [Vicinamibacterales bacterium]|jgi:putative ABC transport system permease protein|nr:ABC transporter permease [Vicinamibacterales bacterium]